MQKYFQARIVLFFTVFGVPFERPKVTGDGVQDTLVGCTVAVYGEYLMIV